MGTLSDVADLIDNGYSVEDALRRVNSGPGGSGQVVLTAYDAEPARAAESNIHGGLLSLSTADSLSSGAPINVTKGTGKLMIVIIAGSDVSGSMTITGDTIDRDTGVKTSSDTETITVDGLSTDGSDTDGNANTRHSFEGAYITSKWFTGSVAISTTDLTLSDVDSYHVSFEQFNDTGTYEIDTLDVNAFTSNVSAEIDIYLYLLKVTGSKCSVSRIASVNLGTNGETVIANRYWRLRRSVIDELIESRTDGIWIDAHYSNSPSWVEDVTIKVWAIIR